MRRKGHWCITITTFLFVVGLVSFERYLDTTKPHSALFLFSHSITCRQSLVCGSGASHGWQHLQLLKYLGGY